MLHRCGLSCAEDFARFAPRAEILDTEGMRARALADLYLGVIWAGMRRACETPVECSSFNLNRAQELFAIHNIIYMVPVRLFRPVLAS